MTVQIFFIYAEGCEHCAEAISIIEKVVAESSIDCDIKKFLFETKVAINIAINHGIDDLPGCVIGRTALQDENINEINVLKAIKEASNE